MIKDSEISHFVTLIKKLNKRKQYECRSLLRPTARYICNAPTTRAIDYQQTEHTSSQIFHTKTSPRTIANISDAELKVINTHSRPKNMFGVYCEQITKKKERKKNRNYRTDVDLASLMNNTFVPHAKMKSGYAKKYKQHITELVLEESDSKRPGFFSTRRYKLKTEETLESPHHAAMKSSNFQLLKNLLPPRDHREEKIFHSSQLVQVKPSNPSKKLLLSPPPPQTNPKNEALEQMKLRNRMLRQKKHERQMSLKKQKKMSLGLNMVIQKPKLKNRKTERRQSIYEKTSLLDGWDGGDMEEFPHMFAHEEVSDICK